ncbi:MAG: YihY/virulence factor BrkB family protein [Bryobacteraceae bacterium]
MVRKLAKAKSESLLAGLRQLGRFFRLDHKVVRELVSETITKWNLDNAPRIGAAIAFYTIFSLTPLLVVIVAVAGLAFGPEAAAGQIVWQIEDLVGRSGAEVIESLLASAHYRPRAGIIASVLGLLTIFFGASRAIAELRDALNTIWGVLPDPTESAVHSVMVLLKERFFSFLLLLGVGALLLVSLLLNAWVSVLGRYFHEFLPTSEAVLQLINFGVFFVVITLLFAATYKFVPDVEISWADVMVGAAATSLLFGIGKFVIGLYLGKSGIGSAYGASGSLVVLLVWIYYSAQVFLLGAEFTQVYANRFGTGLRAKKRLAL